MGRSPLGLLLAGASWFSCHGAGSDSETSGTDATSDLGTSSSGSGEVTSEAESSAESEASDGSTGGQRDIPCDPWVVGDCVEGTKCVPVDGVTGDYDYNETVCRPVAAESVEAGGSCTMPDGPFGGSDNCDATSFCFHVDEENAGTCMPLCVGPFASPSCPGDLVCPMDGDGIVAVCRERCDPASPICTAAGVTCSWNAPWFLCTGGPGSVHPDDVGPDHQGVPENEVCPSPHSCAIGLGCVEAAKLIECGGEACCRPYCDLTANDGGDSECLPGESCTPFMQDPPLDYMHVGICRLP